jgi:hypothetical protein
MSLSSFKEYIGKEPIEIMQHIRLYEEHKRKKTSGNRKMINLDCEGELWDEMKFACAKHKGKMENMLFFGIKVIGKANESDVEGVISNMFPFADEMETTQVKNKLLAGCRDYDPSALYFGVLVTVFDLDSNDKIVNETDIPS